MFVFKFNSILVNLEHWIEVTFNVCFRRRNFIAVVIGISK